MSNTSYPHSIENENNFNATKIQQEFYEIPEVYREILEVKYVFSKNEIIDLMNYKCQDSNFIIDTLAILPSFKNGKLEFYLSPCKSGENGNLDYPGGGGVEGPSVLKTKNEES